MHGILGHLLRLSLKRSGSRYSLQPSDNGASWDCFCSVFICNGFWPCHKFPFEWSHLPVDCFLIQSPNWVKNGIWAWKWNSSLKTDASLYKSNLCDYCWALSLNLRTSCRYKSQEVCIQVQVLTRTVSNIEFGCKCKFRHGWHPLLESALKSALYLNESECIPDADSEPVGFRAKSTLKLRSHPISRDRHWRGT